MANKCRYRVQPKRTRADNTKKKPRNDDRNIAGILVALRYLSLEAQGAGFIELANILENTALKYDPRAAG